MKKKKIARAVGAVVLVSTGIMLGSFLGKRRFIDFLIENDMKDILVKTYPVYKHSTKKYGNLMFEIKAECIGD